MGLFTPFQFSFMQNAFWVVTFLAVPTALLSCFVVLKGWSLMGDAISHATLPGVVIAYLWNLPMIFGAFAAGMFCAVAVGFIKERSRVKQDTVMGIVFSGMFGLGVVLYTKEQTDVHLDHILFGNMLGINAGDLKITALLSGGITLVLLGKWKDFLLHSFDATQARALGLRISWLYYGMLAMISLAVVATLKAVGLILAIGLLISPGAIAFLLTREFRQMMVVATGVNLLAMIGGVYLSFWLDSAPAPTIILLFLVIFITVFLLKVRKTLLKV